ncbi:MAG: RNA-guided pseudouridylation complex pseudouridine synthase subunit Cbf5 [Methanomicrobiales archaeon]|nr:RNA-guided pseudouridylation complex pseudouridine synthase subunit Cbf5 [Methanomicrobiales archaeon]
MNQQNPSVAVPEAVIPSGILVIDKTRGPSSHQVTAWVGKMLGVHVGHSGTLDPQVSGVLLVMLGRAVRLAPLLLQHRKEYVCLMRLHGDTTRKRLEEVMAEFTGRIYQRPPRRSAVARNLRIRTIHTLTILDIEDRLVLFRVTCDAGTYIRSLCHHVGLALGTGAHMQELRRTKSGAFDESNAYTLHDLADAISALSTGDGSLLGQMIQPIEAGVRDHPGITIRGSAVDAVVRGAALAGVGVIQSDQFKKKELIAIKTEAGEFVGIGEALLDSAHIVPGKPGLVVAPRIVFMLPGTYPKGWKTHTPVARP